MSSSFNQLLGRTRSRAVADPGGADCGINFIHHDNLKCGKQHIKTNTD